MDMNISENSYLSRGNKYGKLKWSRLRGLVLVWLWFFSALQQDANINYAHPKLKSILMSKYKQFFKEIIVVF
jgi:hypothetical protein